MAVSLVKSEVRLGEDELVLYCIVPASKEDRLRARPLSVCDVAVDEMLLERKVTVSDVQSVGARYKQ